MKRQEDTQQIQTHRTQELPRTVAMKQTRRVVVGILGGMLILLGIVLLPLPGPWTLLLAVIGLTVLSWEFRWAKRLLYRAKMKLKQVRNRRRR